VRRSPVEDDREQVERSALRAYLFSLAYLAALFCAMVADARL